MGPEITFELEAFDSCSSIPMYFCVWNYTWAKSKSEESFPAQEFSMQKDNVPGTKHVMTQNWRPFSLHSVFCCFVIRELRKWRLVSEQTTHRKSQRLTSETRHFKSITKFTYNLICLKVNEQWLPRLWFLSYVPIFLLTNWNLDFFAV
jgi:hypothetical protein